MAEVQPPIFSQHTNPATPIQHPAELWRRFHDSLLDFRGGIVAPDHLAVTQNGTPNLSVNVAAGSAFVRGTTSAIQGMYWVVNDGTANIPVTDADLTNPRKDLVVARVRDGGYDLGTDFDWLLEVVAGTPAATPVEPAVPASALVLAMIDVPAGDEAISDSQITDRRTGQAGQAQAATLGGIVRCEDTNKPDPDAGRMIYNTQSGLLEIGDGTQYNGLESHSNPTYAIVERVASQSIPHDVWTTVSWDAAVENPFALWAASPLPERLTVTLAGLYLVSVNVHFASNATGDRGVRLRLNDSFARGRILTRAAGGHSTSLTLTRRVRMSPGDWVTAQVLQSSGGSLDMGVVDSEEPRFSVKIERP